MGKGRTAKPKEEQEGQIDLVTEGRLGDGWTDPISLAIEPESRAEVSRYTAAQIKQRRPKTYAAAVQLLAAGFGTVKVAELLELAPDSVRIIRMAEESLSTEKERLGRSMRAVAVMAVDGIADDFADPVKRAKISTKDKAIIAGIVAQRSEELLGGAQTLVVAAPNWSPDELRAALMGLRAAAAQQKGPVMKDAEGFEVIDVGEPEQADAEPGEAGEN